MLKCSGLIIGVSLFVAGVAVSFADEPATQKASPADLTAISAVVKENVTKEVVESVYVEKIIGDFAMATVSVKDGDGGTAFLKRTEKGWTVLNYGNAITESSLVGFGIPEDVAKKMAD